MSYADPPCCPVARHIGKISLVAVLAAGLAAFAIGSIRADDDKDKPKDAQQNAQKDSQQDAAKDATPDAEQAARKQPSSQPPKDAVVLFDGKDLSKWQKYGDGGPVAWKLVEGGAMEVSGGDIITKAKFRDCRIHIEFMPPVMPDATGQAKGNSGVFVMNNYEIQVLDSHGLPKLGMGDCAAIYSKKIPDKNAARPPGQWQTYDMEFKAPRFDASGRKVANSRITIWWNGEKVHDNVEVDGPCPGGVGEKPEGGGIRLQDHGNPVRFRNIWVAPLNPTG